MMRILTDPLELKWKIGGTLGEGWPQEKVHVCAHDGLNDKWWIIFKEIPLRLAQHVVEIHNKRFNDA